MPIIKLADYYAMARSLHERIADLERENAEYSAALKECRLAHLQSSTMHTLAHTPLKSAAVLLQDSVKHADAHLMVSVKEQRLWVGSGDSAHE